MSSSSHTDPAHRPGWQPSVTVVIPTLNGIATIAEVLDAIAGQRYPGEVQVLVVDSSSSDGTAELVRARAGVELRQIPQAEFSHGGTRARAAEWAEGEVVAYLTQDATPARDDWLDELVAPLADPQFAGVFGRQLPRPGAVPVIAYEIERVFADPPRGFYSDTNSAARRELLCGPLPYRDVDFSEDFVFAADALDAGYRIGYAPEAAVWHSNDIALADYAERMRAEVRGYAISAQPLPRYSWAGAMVRAARGALRDEARIIADPRYGPRETLHWLFANPAYHVARWQGIYRGTRVQLPRAGYPE